MREKESEREFAVARNNRASENSEQTIERALAHHLADHRPNSLHTHISKDQVFAYYFQFTIFQFARLCVCVFAAHFGYPLIIIATTTAESGNVRQIFANNLCFNAPGNKIWLSIYIAAGMRPLDNIFTFVATAHHRPSERKFQLM